MDLYSYTGPVTMFDRCVANYWKGETYASSEKKAKWLDTRDQSEPPW